MAQSLRHPAWELYYAAERDVRSALAKLSELGIALANLDLPGPAEATCPFCGIKTKGPNTLAEHLWLLHGGPYPPLVEAADRLAS